jgi:hypothetical protein
MGLPSVKGASLDRQIPVVKVVRLEQIHDLAEVVRSARDSNDKSCPRSFEDIVC